MIKKEILNNIEKEFNISKDFILRNKFLHKPPLTLEILITKIVELYNLDDIYKDLEINKRKVYRTFKSIKCDKDSYEHWNTYFIRRFSSYKHCNRCNNLKLKTEFTSCSSSFDNLNGYCKDCEADRYREYSKDHKHIINQKSANRRAYTWKRTPIWANIKNIKEFYKNCPENMEVDHIVPLKGTKVSGLHVLENLQYLSKSDNCKKSNNFNPAAY